MDLPKCDRISCRPIYSEKTYRVCDRHRVWCATVSCYRKAVGETLEEATSEWTKLMQKPHPEDLPNSNVDDLNAVTQKMY